MEIYLFYTVKDLETLRSDKIKRWDALTGTHELIFEEKDETFSTFVYKTRSKEYIIIGSGSTMSDEYRFIPANEPLAEFQLIQARERGLEYGVSHFGEHFYIRTNADGATNFKLIKAPVTNPSKAQWEDVIAHREEVYLESMELFSDYLVLEERSNGLTQLRIQPWGGEAYYLPFEEEVYTAYLGNNPSFDQGHLRYGYTSLTTPGSVIDYDFKTGEKTVQKQQEVVGGYDASLLMKLSVCGPLQTMVPKCLYPLYIKRACFVKTDLTPPCSMATEVMGLPSTHRFQALG
jgi:oligopeptidase B